MKEHEDIGRNELRQGHVGWGTLTLVARFTVPSHDNQRNVYLYKNLYKISGKF